MRISDWSSDVCSSDLAEALGDLGLAFELEASGPALADDFPFDRTVVLYHCDRDVLLGQVEDGCREQGIDPRRLVLHAHLVLHAPFRLEADLRRRDGLDEIGRTSCRESVCKYV